LQFYLVLARLRFVGLRGAMNLEGVGAGWGGAGKVLRDRDC